MEMKKYGGCGSDLDKELMSMKNRQENRLMKSVDDKNSLTLLSQEMKSNSAPLKIG